MKNKYWIIGSVLAGSVLLAGAVNAGQGCGGSGAYGDHQRGGERGGQMMGMMRGMDMSDEQRQTIREIKMAQRDQMSEVRDEMHSIRDALREQALAENYDAAKVQELASAKAALMASMTVQRTATMNQIYQMMTPEQIAQMDQAKGEGRGCKRGGRHGNHGNHGHNGYQGSYSR